MFDVLVYLYETYYRPDACPDPDTLTRTLTEAGFHQSEISDAINWLSDLAARNYDLAVNHTIQSASPSALRIYATPEKVHLGVEAINFIQQLDFDGVLDSIQREIVIERAMAAKDSSLTLDKLRVIVLMVLWSQGEEPSTHKFDALFPTDEHEGGFLH